MCACKEDMSCDKFDKDKICAMSFVSKLWVVATLKHRTFIKWGPTGESIFLHLSDLDAHLRSLQSMFNAKDCNEFLLNLKDHGFVIVRQDVVSLIEFRHKFFTRDRLEYLCMIANESPNCEPDKKTQERKKFDAGFRMSRDICIMKHGNWTKLQYYQAKFKIAMEYNAAQYALKMALQKRTTLGIPIPAQIFKRPAESILDMERDENFIGYHGEVAPDALEQFFGDRRPIFQPPSETIHEYKPLPPNVFNMDFFNPRPNEREQSRMNNTPSSPHIVKPGDFIPDDFDMRSVNSDLQDQKPCDGLEDDEIFEDDDDDIEPIEEENEQLVENEQEETDDLDPNWANISEYDERTSNKELIDSLPDLNSFFEEECFQNQTAVPFPSQSRFFNDR